MGVLSKIMAHVVPVRFARIYLEYKDRKFTLLDVGCGNHWPSRTKLLFKNVSYHGVDRDLYNNSADDMSTMDKYFQIDLSREGISVIPECSYDVVMLVHVIEHLKQGDKLIQELCSKIKSRGKIYIEYPSVKSLSLPNLSVTLNFSDDESHIRLYDLKEISNLLLDNDFKIIRAGYRRSWLRIFLTPVMFVLCVLRGKSVAPSLLDITGFAEYVYAEKR